MADNERDPKSRSGKLGHEQLRQLLFDEWKNSCRIFPGDPKLLEYLASEPFNHSLPYLISVAIRVWWAWDLDRTQGMEHIMCGKPTNVGCI